ncbi:MAG: hypothetical protein IT233_12395 [Bacteroidia bacterium]|nr:hypothetical protein [Bacteroidia bacterium]
MRRVLFYIFLIFFPGGVFPQLIRFEKVYGAWSHDKGNACVQTWDSGYVVVGSSSSYGNGASGLYMLRLNKYGNFVWHRTFGEVNVDVGMSVVESTDSGIVCVGYTNSYGSGGYDLWVLKTDKNGNFLWQKTYGGSNWDFGNWIAPAAGNGFIVTGSTQSFGQGNSDIWVLRLDQNGDTLWTRTYGGSDEEEGAEIIELSGGDFYLSGKTKSFGSGGYDIISMKIGSGGDTTGGQGWHRIFGGNLDDEGTAVTVTSTNELVTEGNTFSVGFGGSDGIQIRYDLAGNFITFNTFWSAGHEAHYSVLPHESGNFVVFGEKGASTGSQHEFRIDMFAAAGWYVWSSDIGGSDDEIGSQIIRTKDGGFFAVGTTWSYGNGLSDIYVIKTDSAGAAGGNVAVSVEEKLPGLFSVFPNPSCDGAFQIYTRGSGDQQIESVEMFDLAGRPAFITVSTDYRRVVTDSPAAGCFFLRITTSAGVTTIPVCIIR